VYLGQFKKTEATMNRKETQRTQRYFDFFFQNEIRISYFEDFFDLGIKSRRGVAFGSILLSGNLCTVPGMVLFCTYQRPGKAYYRKEEYILCLSKLCAKKFPVLKRRLYHSRIQRFLVSGIDCNFRALCSQHFGYKQQTVAGQDLFIK
jgi:hypothetical protein